mmetsp:Transcript_16902/g.41528  ORF Transcript_16902/g.41528 Transcript_16902/m.41528 type:complete len:387 (+) Transcript_16902:181-1341(+)
MLAMSSSICIGASFIIKKKGLKKAGSSGVRASSGGYGYLQEPLWWMGMVCMIVGEIANFAAYAFAPAILVTPLGALSIIVSAVMAHNLLGEKLHVFGWLGCLLCIVGSISIVLHAPEERPVNSVKELWVMALQPGFTAYATFCVALAGVLGIYVAPTHGSTQILVPIGICSLIGSLSVMSCKALGIAIKLTFEGSNQLINAETWMCAAVVLMCVVTQMNYLNKALDVFNTAVVTPIYYVMFTTLTITASSIMFKDYEHQSVKEVLSQLCGFVTILSGVFVLHVTKDMDMGELRGGGPGSARKAHRLQMAHGFREKGDSPGDGGGMHHNDGLGGVMMDSGAMGGINNGGGGGKVGGGSVDMRVNMPRQLSVERGEHNISMDRQGGGI